MNHIGTILHHLFAGVFDIPTGSAIAGRETNQFHFGARVYAESPFTVSHGTKTLPPRTAAVAIADNDTDLCLEIHVKAFHFAIG